MRSRVELTIAVFLASASITRGQASYVENFDDVTPNGTAFGPYELIDRGWDFRMQSSPPNYMGLVAPFGGWPWGGSQAGPAHIVANYYADGFGGSGLANHWAILPPVPNQAAGDQFSVWMRAADNAYPARIEIRYSPGGGTGTGSGPDEVGDFIQVLMDLNPVPFGPWQQYTTTVPGTGRLAFRYTVSLPVTSQQPRVEIDTLTVGAPCPLPPLPAAGESVTWTLAGSPYTVCRSATIPPGGTVVVQPGVRVNFDDAGILYVEGTLQAAGTTTSRPNFVGQLNSRLFARGGTVDLARCNVGVTTIPLRDGTLRFNNCTFSGQGFIDSSPDALFEQPYFVSLTNCTFNGSSADIQYATLVMRSVTFNSPVAPPILFGGYQFLKGLSANNTAGPSGGLILSAGNPSLYVSDLSITNTAGPALWLWGGNCELAPDTILQNSLVPVHGEWGAGLLPGTVIPATGNTNNHVQIGDHDSFVNLRGADPIWAPVGVPYVARGSVFFSSASLTVLPGVTVKMGLGADLVADQGTLNARGLPDAPIVFERADPAVPWGGFLINSRLENCVIDGSEYGTLSDCDGGRLYVDNCTYKNNGSCVRCATFVRKTQFLDNTSVSQSDAGGGNFDGQTNPNSFVGNLATIHDVADARYNWWGDPSGPSPVGAGDPVGPNTPFAPWRTVQPDLDDAPPVVHIRPFSSLLETGRKVIIMWDVIDELPIASQTVSFYDPDLGEVPIGSNLPGAQRSVEWTVPDVGFDVAGIGHSIWVRAYDAAGQVGWDAISPIVPDGTCPPEDPTLPFSLGGQTFRAGDPFPPLGWSPASNEDFILIDENTQAWTFLGAVPSIARFPNISTDYARLALTTHGSHNCIKFFFDQPFRIRPDARIADAPPVVEMLTPIASASFPGGGLVPITWSASDDEQLRGFDIQVSYDDGRTWDLIVKGLPASATSFDWRLPASQGIPEVRVRTIAHDLRFQSSSDMRSITITPGDVLVPGDIDGDGDVDGGDVELFAGVLMGTNTDADHIARSDLNGDGDANGADIGPFVAALLGG